MSLLLERVELNLFEECETLRWNLWQCPPFLFLILGIITIISMLATYFLASRYVEEPEFAALIVIFITVIFLVVGNSIIGGFKKIAEANRIKTEFISLVSHQLRSPLAIFKWTLGALEREITKGAVHIQEENQNLTKTLRDTTENMIRMVNSVLEISRIEARTLVLKKESFSLNDATKTVIDRYRNYAAVAHIKIVFAPHDALPVILGDRERVEMVIENLIDNAIRYTAEPGTITIKTEQQDSSVVWSIQDEGIGIPLIQQQYIFQKFFRKKSTKQIETRGSGIGLYAAKMIIEALGGDLEFKSVDHKGSLFWFTLGVKKEM